MKIESLAERIISAIHLMSEDLLSMSVNDREFVKKLDLLANLALDLSELISENNQKAITKQQ